MLWDDFSSLRGHWIRGGGGTCQTLDDNVFPTLHHHWYIRYTFHSYLTKQIDYIYSMGGGWWAGVLGFYNKHFVWGKILFFFFFYQLFWSNRYLLEPFAKEILLKESLRISTWLKMSNFIKISREMNENLWESQRILSVIIHGENFGRVGRVSLLHIGKKTCGSFILPYTQVCELAPDCLRMCCCRFFFPLFFNPPKKGKKEGRRKKKNKKKQKGSWPVEEGTSCLCVYTCVCLYHEK